MSYQSPPSPVGVEFAAAYGSPPKTAASTCRAERAEAYQYYSSPPPKTSHLQERALSVLSSSASLRVAARTATFDASARV